MLDHLPMHRMRDPVRSSHQFPRHLDRRINVKRRAMGSAYINAEVFANQFKRMSLIFLPFVIPDWWKIRQLLSSHFEQAKPRHNEAEFPPDRSGAQSANHGQIELAVEAGIAQSSAARCHRQNCVCDLQLFGFAVNRLFDYS